MLSPGALHMASAWLQHSATVWRRGLAPWLLLSHRLKREMLWGCCLVPAFLGLLLLLEASQNDTGNILFAFTLFCNCTLQGMLILCITRYSQKGLFGPQKYHARACTYLIRTWKVIFWPVLPISTNKCSARLQSELPMNKILRRHCILYRHMQNYMLIYTELYVCVNRYV